MFGSFALCLPVVQNLSLYPFVLQSVTLSFPTSPSDVRKTHFYSKLEHNMDQTTNLLSFPHDQHEQ